MMKLIPDIFHHSDWNIQFDTWMYFYKLYLLEFYPAYGNYVKENKEFEKPYKFKLMPKDKMEEDLKDCLEQPIKLYPEKTDEDKTPIMYQCA